MRAGSGPGRGRVRYSEAGRTARSVLWRAQELRISGVAFRVLVAVVQLTATFSKVRDKVYLQEVASVAYATDPAEDWQVKKVREHLKVLEGHGLIRRSPPTDGRRGRNYVIELVYQPGTRWDGTTSEDNVPVAAADDPAPGEGSESGPMLGSDQVPPGPDSGDPTEETSEEIVEEPSAPAGPEDPNLAGAADRLVGQERPGLHGLDDLHLAVQHALTLEDRETVRRALQESNVYPRSVPSFQRALAEVATVSYLPDGDWVAVLRARRRDPGPSLLEHAQDLGLRPVELRGLARRLQYELLDHLADHPDEEVRTRASYASEPGTMLRLAVELQEHRPEVADALLARLTPIERRAWDEAVRSGRFATQ